MTNKDIQSLQTEHPKKGRFLEYYGITRGNISKSASAAEVSRTTYYTWLKEDDQFKAIKETLDQELNDEMREALINLAGEGNLGAIIFYLKSRHPDFKQNKAIGVRTDGEQIEVVIKGLNVHLAPSF